jgi:ubiquinone biosynthesis protein
MLWDALGAARELGRLHDIAVVLIRYGFGDIVERIGMAATLERAGRVLGWRVPEGLARLTPPVRVRRALEDLGPTFIKLGQVLATRVDLFPLEWTTELGKLHDAAPAAPLPDIWAQLKEDLGDDPYAVFAELETQPVAAASLAQVHRARLTDGTAVILKVRRPGIRPVVEADLRLLNRLAEIIEEEAPDFRRYRPREVMAQLTLSLRRELDFSSECRNAERIAANFAACPEIIVPRIHWQWSGERLNVQDYIYGVPGRDLAEVDAAGLDRKLLARRGANAVLKMMLEDGFFQADPHPGNVFYLPDNRIALIDFGMVGRLSEKRRYQVALLLRHLVTRDSASVSRVLLDWGDGTVDIEPLISTVESFLDQYHGVPLKQLDLSAMLSDLVAILRNHGLALPADLALLIKAFIALEGMGRQLDPEFDIAAEATPFLQRVLLTHYAPDAVAERGWRTLGSALDVVNELPQDLTELLRAARRGKFRAQIDVVPLGRFGDRIDRAASRLTMGMVTASLIIGSSIILAAGGGPRNSVLPTFGLFGFTGAAIGGIWVFVSVWRSGRKR